MLEQTAVPQGTMIPPPDVNTGEMKHENPDDTAPDERVELIQTFLNYTKKSQVRTEAEKWWSEADKLYDGQHWSEKMASYRAQLTINLIYPMVENYLALLIEELPELMVLPRDPEDKPVAEAVDRFVKHEWDRNNWTATIGMAYEKAIVRNIAFLKTYWDIHADGGRGAARLEAVSAYDLYLHPGARIRDGKLVTKYAIHHFKMTREEIFAKYGVDPKPGGQADKADFLDRVRRSGQKPHGTGLGPDDLPFGGTFKPSAGAGAKNQGIKNPLELETNLNDMIDCYECWYQDDTRVERENYEHVSDQPAPLMYPGGRILTATDEFILYDGANKHGFFGFVPISPSPDSERLYSKSVVNHCADPQMEYNKRRSQIADHAAHLCNPQREVNVMSGIDTDTITSEPGALIINNGVVDGPAIRPVEVPQLGKEVMESAVMARQDIIEISGMHDVNQGEQPTQVRSGVGIQNLQERARGRANMRAMFLDPGLVETMRNVISMYLDFVPDERKYRFIDQNSLMQFGSFNPIDMLLPRRQTAIAMEMQEMAKVEMDLAMAVETGADQMTIQGIQSFMAQIEQNIRTIEVMPAHDLISFDIETKTNARGMTIAALQALMMQLHQLQSSDAVGGVIDDQALLEALKVPGWQNILQRVIQQAQARAEAAAKAAEEEHQRQVELELVKAKGSREIAEINAESKKEGTNNGS